MQTLRMPEIVADGRRRSGDELDGLARGWLAAVREALDDDAPLVAVVLPTSAEGVALLVALSALPPALALLPPDVRAWRTEPAIPPGTPLVLLPSLAQLAPDARRFGLRPLVLPEGRAPAAAPIEPFTGDGIVLFTSGSTGWPKPVFYRTASLRPAMHNRAAAMGLGPGAGMIIGASPAYAQGFTHVLTAIVLDGPLALLDPRDHRRALETLALPDFECWRASPQLVEAVTRCVLTGPAIVPPICYVSSPITPELRRAFVERFGVPLRQTYSTTETLTVALDGSPADRVQPDTVGRPLPRVEVHVGDHPARPAPTDGAGRIWVRGPWQMAGYGFPPRTDRPGDVDGWWPTHDLGRFRPDGNLQLMGRLDDAIRTRDNRVVNLTHVATRLRDVSAVTDVVVVALDGRVGASFGAVVECGEGLTVAELRAKLAETLPPWSWPRTLELVRALPRLPNGKPDRQACARLLGAAPAT